MASSTFDSVDIDPRLLRAVAKLGFTHMTPVQAAAIPLALQGKDILARARTGSGKTVAYCLPVIQKILSGKSVLKSAIPAVRALILVPTRELAEQVNRVLRDLTIYGGKEVSHVNIATTDISLNNQRPILLEKPDVIVSTPSRVLSHIEAGNLDLKDSLETLVIDEADLILSYGHDEDIRKLLPLLPRICQSLLMSATITSDVQQLKQLVLRKPAILKLEESGDGEGGEDPLDQYQVAASESEKFLLTYFLLKLKVHPFGSGKTILFVNDTDRCYKLKLFLEQFGIRSCALNSSLPLKSRYHVVEEFNRGVYDIIIATDESGASGGDDADDNDDGAELDVERESGRQGAGDDAEKVDGTNEDEDAEDAGEGSKDENGEMAAALGSDGDDGNEGAEETPAAKSNKRPREELTNGGPKNKKSKKNRQPSKDSEYGVSRGVDFRRVQAVINFDLPDSARAYMHRVGRTARGLGNKGYALSFFVAKEMLPEVSLPRRKKAKEMMAAASIALPPGFGDEKVMERIVRKQEGMGRLIKTFVFNMEEVNAFKYRVDDALKAVTRSAIKEARLKEIKHEIMNSEKLKASGHPQI